jgi:hypothetical protein
MRIARLVPLLIGAVFVGGCGGHDDGAPVSLAISTPADTSVVHEDAVDVSGRVRPANADVVVLGREADVEGSSWHARVPLQEGANVIDVAASAPGRAATWSALRVSRRSLVKVPDLAGQGRDDAVDALGALGLRADVEQGHGLLDRLLPGGWGVCRTDPDAGARVPKGARVRVEVSKTC